MNNWYAPNSSNTSGWYAPLHPAPSVSQPEAPSRQPRRRAIRIIAFILILALLASALSYSIVPRSGKARPVIGAGDWNEGSEPAEFPEDFGDFFSQYYTATENEKIEVRIPGGEERLVFDLTLDSPSGEELTLQELYRKCARSEEHTSELQSRI